MASRLSNRTSNYSSATSVTAAKVGQFHAHACVTCGRRYQDACPNKLTNALCSSCRTGQQPPTWDRDRFPISCCKKPDGCRVAYTEDRERYSLGGETMWFICRTCARTHPFDPSGTESTGVTP